VAVCAALFVPLAASAAGPATSVRTVSPLTPDGALKDGYRVVHLLRHGTCQNGSFMTGVADRCSTPQTHGAVLDPCWPTPHPRTYVCQAKPWQHKVVKLHVDGSAAGGPGQHHQALPWGMRVGGKVRCLLDVGSVRRLNGHQLLYHCTHHRDVFRPLRHGGSRWKAHVYRTHASTRSGYRAVGWRPVRVAWYGAEITAPATPSPTPSPTVTNTASPTPAP
jgi:hypothetical protein